MNEVFNGHKHNKPGWGGKGEEGGELTEEEETPTATHMHTCTVFCEWVDHKECGDKLAFLWLPSAVHVCVCVCVLWAPVQQSGQRVEETSHKEGLIHIENHTFTKLRSERKSGTHGAIREKKENEREHDLKNKTEKGGQWEGKGAESSRSLRYSVNNNSEERSKMISYIRMIHTYKQKKNKREEKKRAR